MDLIIKRRCYKCHGVGVLYDVIVGLGQTITVDPCPTCLGSGVVDSLKTVCLPDNVFHSHEILEAIDATEYDGLTVTQKSGVQLILSCGLVDLNEGKVGRVRLLSWFGGGSTTVANLTALLV